MKKRIKDLMEQKKISVYKLAEDAELTEACIRNWYTKRNYTPSLEALEKVSRALNVSVAELVRDDEEEQMSVSAQEKTLLENWYRLEERQKNAILVQINAFLNN